LDAKEVADLYSCRWDVELTFKELKSRYALDKIPSANEQVVRALIWTAILTLVVSRRLYNFVRSQAPERMRVRYTQLRWATLFCEEAATLLCHVLLYLRVIKSPAEMMSLRLSVYGSPVVDPHVNRDRLKAGWVS